MSRLPVGDRALLLLAVVLAGLLGGLMGGAAVWLLTPDSQLPPGASRALVLETPTPAPPVPVTLVEESSTTRAVARILPAVVTVLRQDGGRFEALGSGIVIDRQGHVLTNAHVVAGAAEPWVAVSDGRRAPAPVRAADEFTDLAVLAGPPGLAPGVAELADSSRLVLGQRVIAVGSVLGEYTDSVTTGVVSGLGRTLRVDGLRALEGLIQTDAAINRGSSGGPLVNLQGQVVGLNTILVTDQFLTGQFVRSQGIGFAIPSATIREVLPRLAAGERVRRPYTGLTLEAAGAALPAAGSRQAGLAVLAVDPGSPAEAAGIRPGDSLTHLEGHPLGGEGGEPFLNLVFRHQPGELLRLTGLRQGRTLQWVLELEAR